LQLRFDLVNSTYFPVERSQMSEMQVALLRGINVGGKNKLPMKDLVVMFAEAGCSDVRNFIQSGNILFRAPPRV
jgi:uncharacterized protein (DUF1697 family)